MLWKAERVERSASEAATAEAKKSEVNQVKYSQINFPKSSTEGRSGSNFKM
jgi:hypothetical protein